MKIYIKLCVVLLLFSACKGQINSDTTSQPTLSDYKVGEKWVWKYKGGTMAIQLAKHMGAHVASVCSSRNFELVKSLSSDAMIDYTLKTAEKQLETYKYVIDAVGNSKTSKLKDKSKKALTPNGKYISIDHGTPLTPKEAFFNLKTLVEQGKIKPVIDRIYPLEKMAKAHRYVEMGHKRGNVIITI
ncbi:zinc-binding dehydrogenase [Aequorivita viscosa]|nr:zinc-binding dehydrogenase [Aequorivita viscosa]